MAFKLVVGDRLSVVVKGAVPDGTSRIPFQFTLQMRRLDVEEYRRVLSPDADVLVRDFLLDNTFGWHGQKLVTDDDDQPEPYSREAFECLLGVVGMEQHCFGAYLAAMAIADKPAGRAGN